MDKVYVVRKHWGLEGSAQHYSHAEIKSDYEWSAICEAMKDTTKWRRVDDFDISDRTFVNFSIVDSYEEE